jgi:hypothetical protein
MSALDKQVAGNHYKNQKIQPIELAYMLGQTPAFCKVAKYATRIKDDPIQQLNKALHCIELDEDLKEYKHLYRKAVYHFAEDMIYKFTEDSLLRDVLISMHTGDYVEAKFAMNEMIMREECKDE